MKKIFLFILFTNAFSYAQIINIPDTTFKTLLLQSNSINGVAGIVIDTNNDGEIEQSEALLVDYLDFPPGNISDLTGIEFFTNIRDFGCRTNNLISANLTSLIHLKTLDLGANHLTNLDLTGLTDLWFINCAGNELHQIDFSSLSALRIVICNQNPTEALDFSNNPLLDQLSCSYSPNLTTIKIKNNTQQIFTQTAYNGCWDNNPSLTTICADAFEVTTLQTFLANCNITQPINIVTDCALKNENFVTYNFSLTPNPTKETICFNNSKSKYKIAIIYNYLGQEILCKKIEAGFNENLNLSLIEKGIYIIHFSNENESFIAKIIKD